jgi:hypothetical protein
MARTIATAGSRRPIGVPPTFGSLSVSFDFTDAEFGERFLPWVRLACLCIQRDFIGVEQLARDMVRQGGEGRLDEADRAWSSCAEAFNAITEFVEAAKVRLALVRGFEEAENSMEQKRNRRID